MNSESKNLIFQNYICLKKRNTCNDEWDITMNVNTPRVKDIYFAINRRAMYGTIYNLNNFLMVKKGTQVNGKEMKFRYIQKPTQEKISFGYLKYTKDYMFLFIENDKEGKLEILSAKTQPGKSSLIMQCILDGRFKSDLSYWRNQFTDCQNINGI